MMMYRHGLRVSEAIALRTDDLDLAKARLWVRRLKNSLSVEHPIAGDELRAIKRYLATREDKLRWLFISERGQPMTRQAVNYLIGAAAASARLHGVHPHTLRHSCGYYLADRGTDLRTMQDYLGHRDPRHTVYYTRVSGRRFEGLWK
jgi:site-specific recombinase XerD